MKDETRRSLNQPNKIIFKKYKIDKEKKENEIRKKLEREKEILDTRVDEPGIPTAEAEKPKRKKVTWRVSQKLRKTLLSARADHKLKEIDKAVECLEKGEYGICLNCRKKIDPKRLEVMPTVVLCYECSQKAVKNADTEVD